MGNADRAIDGLGRAADTAPDRVRHWHLGQACLQAGWREDAIRTFARVRNANTERRLLVPDDGRRYRKLSAALPSPSRRRESLAPQQHLTDDLALTLPVEAVLFVAHKSHERVVHP
jgi:hypothetical protein